jgi:hypothetical protein
MSKWREKFKVHPAADVFPMMSDEELKALAADIKEYDLLSPIVFWHDDDDNEYLLDGRNRLDAMELTGIPFDPHEHATHDCTDPIAYIASANLHRRHMLKIDRAKAIVALAKLGQVGPVSEKPHKGGRGKVNPIKAKALEINAGLPENERVSERTIKREIEANYERPTEHPNAPPRLRAKARRQKRRETLQHYSQLLAQLPRNVEGARRFYLEVVAKLGADPEVEMQAVIDGLQRIADKRAKPNGLKAEVNA